MKFFYLSRQERFTFISLFTLLTCCLVLTSAFQRTDIESDSVPKTSTVKVQINRATVIEWAQLPKVYTKLAERIIKYRNMLGGFYSKKQLMEVYGLDSSRYNASEQYLILDSSWHKMELNKVEFKVMLKHPYFDYDIVKSIFSYKNQNNGYDSLLQIKELNLVNDEIYSKIAPYLTVESDREST